MSTAEKLRQLLPNSEMRLTLEEAAQLMSDFEDPCREFGIRIEHRNDGGVYAVRRPY